MNTTQDSKQAPGLLARIGSFFSSKPTNRDDVVSMLRDAHGEDILDGEALEIMEGALSVADKQVREIMIPRSQMKVIPIDADLASVLGSVVESKHSRYPVVGESANDIKGILLAKDLLPLALNGHEDFALENIIRPATIIPESKRLNVLLKEFREQRYHMAVVMDEYANVAGLVTIEDILEEIVGEIEDETDEQERAHITPRENGSYLLTALTPIEDFNEFFGTGLSEDEFDTIGGIVTQTFGHLPKPGEITHIDNHQFKIIEADARQIHLLELELISQDAD